MEILFSLCTALSIGVLIGFLFGGIRLIKKRSYTQRQIQITQNAVKGIAVVLKYATILVLLLGLIWCCYFLVLGVYDPELSGYATNISQLIVSVLTLIFIMFAFFEFFRKK